MKKALITGINGQDGSYLAELLLEKGYEVQSAGGSHHTHFGGGGHWHRPLPFYQGVAPILLSDSKIKCHLTI
jgi:hypothetical protein